MATERMQMEGLLSEIQLFQNLNKLIKDVISDDENNEDDHEKNFFEFDRPFLNKKTFQNARETMQALQTFVSSFFDATSFTTKNQKEDVVVVGSKEKPENVTERDWEKRHLISSRWDQGFMVQNFYYSTVEWLAEKQAKKMGAAPDVFVVDAFCGSGMNAIQCAKLGALVLAIDNDPLAISIAQHNSRLYGVQDRVFFVCADAVAVAPLLAKFALQNKIVYQALYLSPPWKGRGYRKENVFDAETMQVPLSVLQDMALAVKARVSVFYLPENTDKKQLYFYKMMQTNSPFISKPFSHDDSFELTAAAKQQKNIRIVKDYDILYRACVYKNGKRENRVAGVLTCYVSF